MIFFVWFKTLAIKVLLSIAKQNIFGVRSLWTYDEKHCFLKYFGINLQIQFLFCNLKGLYQQKKSSDNLTLFACHCWYIGSFIFNRFFQGFKVLASSFGAIHISCKHFFSSTAFSQFFWGFVTFFMYLKGVFYKGPPIDVFWFWNLKSFQNKKGLKIFQLPTVQSFSKIGHHWC